MPLGYRSIRHVGEGFVRFLMALHLAFAQALLPAFGHAHAPTVHEHGDCGFHIHFGDGHHSHDDFSHDDSSHDGGFEQGEDEDESAVLSLGIAAWESVKADSVAAQSSIFDFAAPSFTASFESWTEWPPEPLATPPTSASIASEFRYLSFCCLRC